MILLKCEKIQTLAPGAAAPESRAPVPKMRIISENFEGMAWHSYFYQQKRATDFPRLLVDHQ